MCLLLVSRVASPWRKLLYDASKLLQSSNFRNAAPFPCKQALGSICFAVKTRLECVRSAQHLWWSATVLHETSKLRQRAAWCSVPALTQATMETASTAQPIPVFRMCRVGLASEAALNIRSVRESACVPCQDSCGTSRPYQNYAVEGIQAAPAVFRCKGTS